MRNPITALFLALFLVAPTWAGSAADDIEVIDPWAREIPPNMTTSAGFLAMKNSGSREHKLVGAESPVTGMVELHTHINDQGVMRMRPVENMPIPAGGTTELKPGGLHLMLMRLKKPIKAGDKLPITLIFEDGSRKEIEAEVRRFDMMMKSSGSMHMKH
ncbi:MAG TPA: copper chaperone PCu(A)C [Chromatiaceae bacterium]|nr:copper chaperone PCu(A)C [Chromatiaceae bacterium]